MPPIVSLVLQLLLQLPSLIKALHESLQVIKSLPAEHKQEARAKVEAVVSHAKDSVAVAKAVAIDLQAKASALVAENAERVKGPSGAFVTEAVEHTIPSAQLTASAELLKAKTDEFKAKL